MSQDCATGCGRPVGDAPVCSGCADATRADLEALADHLAAELDVTLTRQARLGDRNGGRGAERPLPFDPRASEVGWSLRNTLGTTIRDLAENRAAVRHGDGLTEQAVGDRYPPDDVPSMASWLAEHIEDIRHHAAAGELVDELRAIVGEVRRVIDRPADRWYAGRCACETDLYVKAGQELFMCPGCKAAYTAADRRDYLRGVARDLLATATEISRALASLGVSSSPAAIRGYVHRGRLQQRGEMSVPGRPAPVPVYRFGDVLELMQERPARRGA